VDTDPFHFYMLTGSQGIGWETPVNAQPIAHIASLVVGDYSVSIFSYAGDPNGQVTALNAGDICFDNTTPATWQASAAGNSSWVKSGGAVFDIGLVTASARNTIQSVDYANTAVAPDPTMNYGNNPGSTSHAPIYQSDWLPLQVVNPGDLIEVLVTWNLSGGLWDTVDLNGTIVVWDQAGLNLFYGTWAYPSVSGSGSGTATLTQVQLIGTDLSESSNAITSSFGGVYNVLINTSASWN
jgi:hypothetical protein